MSRPTLRTALAIAGVIAILAITFAVAGAQASAATQTVEGETFVLSGTHSVVSDSIYSGGKALKINDTTSVSYAHNITTEANTDITVYGKSGTSGGFSSLQLVVDGNNVGSAVQLTGSLASYNIDANISSGTHDIGFKGVNVATGRNAFVDKMDVVGGGSGGTTPNPNLLTANQSSFETTDPNWTGIWGYFDSTGSFDNTQAQFGSQSVKIDITSTQVADAHGAHGVYMGAEAGGTEVLPANTQVRGSAYVKAPAGKTIYAAIRGATSGGAYLGEQSWSSSITTDGTWQRITTSAHTFNQDFKPGLIIATDDASGAFSFNVDGAKVETGTNVTDWTIGTGGGGTPSQAACADGLDNDGDGKTDYPDDPGCSSSTDNDETDPAATPLPPGFTQSRVVSGLTDPTDMEFAPDGRLFVTEQAGRVRIAKPDGTLATFLDISTQVNSSGERGLQALTFDPGFSTNRYVYLHYTKKATSTTPVHNRIVRVTANADSTKVVSGSETLILQLNNQSTDHHMGGAIDFGTDGKLYIATGDNETPNNAQQLTNLFGKMLRINKDGTIPTDNPFYSTASGNNRAIWALGLRNPFKFAVQPGTSTIFINDVGEDAWEEINRGAAGANYGWNTYEGPESDPQYENPIFAYGHDGAIETTGCSITGGAFYDPTTATTSFASYQGKYFYTDFCSGWIRVFDPSSKTDSAFASGIVKPVDLEVGDNGSLYYLYRGSSSVPAAVGEIR